MLLLFIYQYNLMFIYDHHHFQLFLLTSLYGQRLRGMEQEITAIGRQAEERLNELHPDQRREYDEMREESKRLSADLADARDELNQAKWSEFEL